tara:strand:- start:2199 stop:3062 length:864 start_codon:yes stop_codon:yes gene_type:complete
MKSLLLSLTLCLSALTNAFAANVNFEEISVMSFNIRYGTAKDGDNAWPHRRDIVIETIQQRAPDLLGLQEAIDFQVEYLAEKLPEYAVYSVSRTPGPGGESCAIFFRRDRFENVDEGTFWLSEKPDEVGSISWDSSLPRIASWVKLRSKASGKQLLYANTHFDHKGSVARAESAKLIRSQLATIAGETPVVITGDFNCGEGSAPYTTLTDPNEGYQDTFRTANPNQDLPNEITFTGFGLRPGNARIDWVLCSDHWTILSAGIDRYRGKDGRYPSDHEPVFCILTSPF